MSYDRRFLSTIVLSCLALMALGVRYARADESASQASSDRIAKLADRLLKMDAEQALTFVERILLQPKDGKKPDYPHVATNLTTLGAFFRERGKYAHAEAFLNRALSIREEAFGRNHPSIATSLTSLASLFHTQARYAEAEPLFLRSRAIYEQALGVDHPYYATSLNNLAMLYSKTGEYDKAAPLYQEALAIKSKAHGKEHPSYALSLDNLATLYRSMGEYAKAEPLLQQALEIRKTTLGENHPSYATSLHNVASLYQNMGDYTKAKAIQLQVVDILRAALGEEHPQYATGLNGLALVCASMGNYTEAEAHYHQVIEIRRKALGEKHPRYATSLNNLAILYVEMGEYAKAEPLFLQALDIDRARVGEEHLSYATTLANLASLLQKMGEYRNAESLYRQAFSIYRNILGDTHPRCGVVLANLALMYSEIGEYAKAESLYLETIEIQREAVGEAHPSYATSQANLASLYHNMGEYGKAEDLYRSVLEVMRKTLGDDHSACAKVLNNIARSRSAQGDDVEAKRLYTQATALWEKALGVDHPDVAIGLSNVAMVSLRQGEYAQSEAILTQSLQIREKALGPEHPDIASSLTNIALLHHTQGNYEAAEPLLRRVLAIREKVFGFDHPSVLRGLNSLARLYAAQAEYPEAERLFRDAFEGELNFLVRTSGLLSEGRAVTLGEKWGAPDLLLSVLRELPDHKPQDAHDVFWRSRAVITQLLAERRRRVAGLPEAEVLYERLQSTQQQLAQLTLAEAAPEQREARRERLVELNDEKEAVETELAQISNPFRREIELERAGPKELARVLPQDTAVIDIAAVNLWQPRPDGGKLESMPHYEAFVMQPVRGDGDLQVTWVHLGPVKPIDQALATWRKAIIQREVLPLNDDRPDRILRRLVWEKLEPHLVGHSDVYVIPDGELAFLPWVALPGRRPGTCLIEDYNIVTATHGQELYRGLTEASSTSGGLLLIGDIYYDRAPPAPAAEMLAAADAQTPLTRSPAPGTESVWRRLPATAEEMANIKQTWDSRGPLVVLRGEEAGESAVRDHLPGNRYIHLATHGFFADEKFRSMFGHDVGGEQLFGEPGGLATSRGQVTARNPLILTGVVLAGANLPLKTDELGLPTGEDGILTAEEIVSFDLRGTELVVLSACETGLGSVGGGEGVFGLQRAFHLAGARNVIASLWKVDDQAAAALMRVFYHKLWHENKSPAVALREAQLTLYRQPDQIDKLAGLRGPDFDKIVSRKDRQPDPGPAPANIRRWAAFVLSGPGR